MCLERGPYGLRSIAMGFSKFDVARGAGGDAHAAAQHARHGRRRRTAVRLAERTLDEFRRLAARVLGRQSRQVEACSATEQRRRTRRSRSSRAAGDGSRPTAERRFLVQEHDGGTARGWDAVNEIQTALAAWTNPASASITLQYAGHDVAGVCPKARGQGFRWRRRHHFEDPNNEISVLTLAIGGGSAERRTGSGGTIGGNRSSLSPAVT